MPAALTTPSHQHDRLGRLIGLAVFFAGVGLLAWVFVRANDLFNAPPPAVPNPPAPPPPAGAGASAAPSPFVPIAASFATLLRQLLLLLLMSVAGSLMASKGVQMFFAARPLPGDSSGPASAPPAVAMPKSGNATSSGTTKTPAA
jgi:hypothetical protein